MLEMPVRLRKRSGSKLRFSGRRDLPELRLPEVGKSGKDQRPAADGERNMCGILEKRKHRSDNKSGFRGVFLTDRNTYRVSITLQGKRYNLGTFSNFDDAVAARMEAEEKLYGKFLESYKEWEEHADQDPEWARTHPFEYQAG